MSPCDEQTPSLQTGGAPSGTLAFQYGHPDPDAFPLAELRSAIDATLQHHIPSALLYGPEQGPTLLLNTLCKLLTEGEGLDILQEQVFVTAGASEGLDLICRLWTQPGDVVLVEAPSYHEALGILRDYPVQLVSVPLDGEGLIVEAVVEARQQLQREGRSLAFLYTIPSFQNPSGVTLSSERRRALAGLAADEGLWVVEDDVYRDLCYEGTVPPSLFELAAGQRVLRLGSFSKTLAPGLRLGWVLAPPEAVRRMAGSGLRRSAGGANPFTAMVVAEFCRAGYLSSHIARLVTRYRARRDAMLEALDAAMPPGVTWTRPRGGFFVWLTLPSPLSARDVLSIGQDLGISFPTGEPFFAAGDGEQNIRLPFSYISPDDIRHGMQILGHAIRSLS